METRDADDWAIERVVIDAAALERLSPMQVVDPLWWQVDVAQDPASYEASFAPYTRRQRLVWAMCWHSSEVGNGGHDQFFWNSTGIVWRDALAGYDDAGLADVATLLRAAAALLGGDPPIEKAARRQLMESYGKTLSFDDIDDAFYPILNGGLNDRMMTYIRAHAADFMFDGMVRRPRGWD